MLDLPNMKYEYEPLNPTFGGNLLPAGC